MTVKDNKNTVVYILPNPKSVTSMDIIIKNRQRLAAYDVKTVTGTHSALNRLKESIGQTQRVLLNVTSKYRAGDLWYEIKTYFEKNQDAIEVLVYINGKKISVQRQMMNQKTFVKMCYR